MQPGEAPPPPPPPPPPGAPPRRRQRRGAAALLLAAVLVLATLASLMLAGLIPNPLVTTSARSEWAFTVTDATDLNARGFLGQGITVCIVDTGIDPNHPDLRGVHLRGWFDTIGGLNTPYDDSGHGSAMAGLIAANGTYRGVAPAVNLMVTKAILANGSGDSHNVALAIRWCVDPNGDGNPAEGANVISLSLGGSVPSSPADEATIAAEQAVARGIVVLAAAGNDGQHDDGDVQQPAADPLVIAVGAVDQNGLIASFSSRGSNVARADPNKKPEAVAPGVSLVAPWRGGGRVLLSGTSVATALAAGLTALLLQAKPQYLHGSGTTVGAFKTALMRGALKLDSQVVPHDDHYGYGLFAASAVLMRL